MADDPREPPATGARSTDESDLGPEEEPVVIGTLFLSLLLLIGILGAWFVAYWMLLNR